MPPAAPNRATPTNPGNPRQATSPASPPELNPAFQAVCDELQRGTRFVLTSHAKPDGDSVGSQIALALALEQLGKQARIVNVDPPPSQFRHLPGTERVEVARSIDGEYDALVVLECSDLTRPGLDGLERFRIVNVDHHVGNTGYGAVNWFDSTAAACTELVTDILDGLGVSLTLDMASHIYLGILTDTGGFHHGNVTPRTFEICRRAAAAGVNATGLSQRIYNNANVGRLRLLGTLLENMRLEADGRLAVLYFDDEMLRALGATHDDTEGLINVPLSARSVKAVALVKGQDGTGDFRVSLRSKDLIDVRSVAQQFGGGGHVNAAGFSVKGPRDAAQEQVIEAVRAALDREQ